MSFKRIQQRVPSAMPLGTFSLPEHQLLFHKVGKDGTAKCNAHSTGNTANSVLGRLYEIDASEKSALDSAEGLGHGYEEKIIKVINAKGNVLKAITYYATDINNSLHPFTWYKQHVLIGAREANLPEEYIGIIESIRSIEDYDTVRATGQLSIHM
jgi:AIG2 family protein